MKTIVARRQELGPPKSIPERLSARRPARPKFSQELQDLARRFADRPTPLAELIQATQGRGFHLMLLCISLPFVTPIPLPGLSTPFGLVVALIGARLTAGRKPWLPKQLLARELPPRFLTKMLQAATSVVRLLEFCLKPRLSFLHESLVFRRVAGYLIFISGVLMLLPLPLPFCNSFPAFTVLLLAAGALERDGVAFLAGCAMFLVTSAYFALLTFGGAHAIEAMKHALLGG
jgi:hypothetical protein